jgi:hypothetical protein
MTVRLLCINSYNRCYGTLLRDFLELRNDYICVCVTRPTMKHKLFCFPLRMSNHDLSVCHKLYDICKSKQVSVGKLYITQRYVCTAYAYVI